ncbi:uncharacterized protein TNIN_64011 [Trichonephila inaurata madagascariensis]|uniref:Uncharacterized protein n=1 Tax=Trichonephila inaurata madagascariensis TaxID=2747483 RepID=A0A8X6YS10_9ARAC|nr:uncharacterized protein TNIN_64011 [Trichonephila inaurata madagascariensis]
MPREDTDNLTEETTQLKISHELNGMIGDMSSIRTKNTDLENLPLEDGSILNEPYMIFDLNYAVSRIKKQLRKQKTVSTIMISSCHKQSKHLPLSGKERKTLKIRYTRQYLLDRRYDPLATTFPNCLLKFLQSGEVPLKETENCCEYRSMDHILFYTSLPYTRMRNSLNTNMKRTPFKLCY